jgi:hypothetical protein
VRSAIRLVVQVQHILPDLLLPRRRTVKVVAPSGGTRELNREEALELLEQLVEALRRLRASDR